MEKKLTTINVEQMPDTKFSLLAKSNTTDFVLHVDIRKTGDENMGILNYVESKLNIQPNLLLTSSEN